MVVRRKPPANVEEFIQEGGAPPAQVVAVQSAAQPKPKAEKDVEKGLKLRLPESLLQRVDDAVAQRRPAPSRHQWILEAIYEKLDREVKKSE